MESTTIEQFKAQLDHRRQDLKHLLLQFQEAGRIADSESSPDVSDRATNSYTKELLFSQGNNERQLLKMVQEALHRIEDGNFGDCLACGKEINVKRLHAVPWARYCIACQEQKENRQLEAQMVLGGATGARRESPSE